MRPYLPLKPSPNISICFLSGRKEIELSVVIEADRQCYCTHHLLNYNKSLLMSFLDHKGLKHRFGVFLIVHHWLSGCTFSFVKAKAVTDGGTKGQKKAVSLQGHWSSECHKEGKADHYLVKQLSSRHALDATGWADELNIKNKLNLTKFYNLCFIHMRR